MDSQMPIFRKPAILLADGRVKKVKNKTRRLRVWKTKEGQMVKVGNRNVMVPKGESDRFINTINLKLLIDKTRKSTNKAVVRAKPPVNRAESNGAMLSNIVSHIGNVNHELNRRLDSLFVPRAPISVPAPVANVAKVEAEPKEVLIKPEPIPSPPPIVEKAVVAEKPKEKKQWDISPPDRQNMYEELKRKAKEKNLAAPVDIEKAIQLAKEERDAADEALRLANRSLPKKAVDAVANVGSAGVNAASNVGKAGVNTFRSLTNILSDAISSRRHAIEPEDERVSFVGEWGADESPANAQAEEKPTKTKKKKAEADKLAPGPKTKPKQVVVDAPLQPDPIPEAPPSILGREKAIKDYLKDELKKQGKSVAGVANLRTDASIRKKLLEVLGSQDAVNGFISGLNGPETPVKKDSDAGAAASADPPDAPDPAAGANMPPLVEEKEVEGNGSCCKDTPKCAECSGDYGLSNFEIDKIMEPWKKNGMYKGTYSVDTFDDLIKETKHGIESFGFIFNTLTSKESEEGEVGHWVAVYIDSDDFSVYYIDSYGDEPSEEFLASLKNLLNKMGAPVYYKMKINRIKQQAENSSTCGYHSMRNLVKLFNGEGFKDVTGWSEVRKNEKDIKKYIRHPALLTRGAGRLSVIPFDEV